MSAVYKSPQNNSHNYKKDGKGIISRRKGVFGGPSGPSREGPGVGHKIVSDTKQMTKERKKNEWEKGKICKEKKWKKEREKNGQK